MNDNKAKRFIFDMKEIDSTVAQLLRKLGKNEADAGDLTQLLALKGKCLVLKAEGNNLRRTVKGKSKEIMKKRVGEIVLTRYLIEGMTEALEKTLFLTAKK